MSEAFESGHEIASCLFSGLYSSCAPVRSTIKALALFATRSGLGDNITPEVAEYEARDVLFGRVGAIKVSPSITIIARDH